MKAVRFDGRLRVVTDAAEPARDGEALVEVVCAGICNTDLEIVKGYAGFRGTLGHEFVGRVVDSPVRSLIGRRVVGEINAGCGECSLCLAGDARHCPRRTVLGIKGRDGAFAELLSLPARNLLELPDTVPDEAAVFVEPLAAACRVLEQVAITRTSRVAVIGDGKLAQLILRVIAGTGCDLTVIGKHEAKLELAASAAARPIRIDDRLLASSDTGEQVLKLTSNERFDVVVEASGSPTGMAIAIALVRPLGSIVLKSTHHGETSLRMSPVVVDEVTVIGSRCGRFRPAIELLESGKIDVRPLISSRYSIDDAAAAFEKAADPACNKVLILMD
ncbi:MAG TPA: alcohol dehydrogenase catalytic domain-containing protein [Blastocatellia bacterium]|nr:alcohol dehydrogenase catalytic domain-containing protein [Blastocatellia bacterium]